MGGIRRREGWGRRGLGWRISTVGSWFGWWIAQSVDVGGDLQLVETWMALEEKSKGENGSGMCWLLVPYLLLMPIVAWLLRCTHARWNPSARPQDACRPPRINISQDDGTLTCRHLVVPAG